MTYERLDDGRLVGAWLKEPTWLEPVNEGRVAAIVHQTPQARRWPPRVDFGRFSPMFNATKFVAASVILALVGGFLLTSLPSEPAPEPIPAAETATATASPSAEPDTETEPPPSDTARLLITLAEQLPEGVESGTIQTPAGPARWVKLRADADDPFPPFPYFVEQVLPWGDGLASWEDYSGMLYTTSDGVTWEQPGRPFPRGSRIRLVGDTYVVVDRDVSRVWTSTDPEVGWNELDASATVPARSTGWETTRPRLGTGPMLVDGRIVFTIETPYNIPRQKLGISTSGTKNLRQLPDRRYALCGGGGCRDGATNAKWIVRLEETPKGLEVFRDKTGKRLGLIKGASADEIYEGQYGKRHRIFAIDGDKVVEIDSPWPGLRPAQVSNRIVAPGGTTPVLKRWRSDGIADPATNGLPSIATEVPKSDVLQVWLSGDRLDAHVRSSEGGAVTHAWESTDGIDWRAQPAGVPDGAEARWIGSGWLATPRNFKLDERWMHLGGDWVSLEAMAADGPPVPLSAAGLDGVTLLTGNPSESHTLWVLIHPDQTG